MDNQRDLFGAEHSEIRIKDNAILERACNRLLDMIRRNPELLDGDSMGEIDHRVFAEILWEDGFQNLISHSKKQIFIDAVMKVQESDIFTRARRELLSRDLIRVSSKAIQSGERFRVRIAGAMR